jgi:hypothetical protein
MPFAAEDDEISCRKVRQTKKFVRAATPKADEANGVSNGLSTRQRSWIFAQRVLRQRAIRIT